MNGFIDPEKILKELDLKESAVVAEFGCGSGKLALALAKKLRQGKIIALDIQKEPLSALKGRVSAEGLLNLETIQCDLEKEKGSTLANESVDFVLIPNMLFQTEDKKAVMSEAKRILKRKGEIAIIDWKLDASLGPKQGRISVKELKKIAEDLGLTFKQESLIGSFHYFLLLSKK